MRLLLTRTAAGAPASVVGALLACTVVVCSVVACSPPTNPANGTAKTTEQTPAAKPAFELVCGGLFTRATTRKDLETHFGVENVVAEPFGLGEGDTAPGLVVFPNDPSLRLEILLTPKGRGITAVRTGGAPSQWVGPKGLQTGSTLAQVEAANGRMFLMSGFDWDYGGMVTNWGGEGALTPTEDGCSTGMRFTYDNAANRAAVSEVQGDGVYSSQLPAMRTLAPTVASFSITFAQE